jgi:hypothetical protein
MPDLSKKPVEIVQDESKPVAFDVSGLSDEKLKAEVDAVKVSLAKKDLQGIRARVILLLDFSGSMAGGYVSGKVQALIRRVLAFGMNVDTDGQIEVFRFGSSVDSRPLIVDAGNYATAADVLAQGQMGSTNLTAGLRKIAEIAREAGEVIYLFVITDGQPDDDASAVLQYVELADLPVFVKNLAIREVSFLKNVDEFKPARGLFGRQRPDPVYAPLATRTVDNCNTQFVYDPDGLSPEKFAELATVEWHDWFIAAQHAGILV